MVLGFLTCCLALAPSPTVEFRRCRSRHAPQMVEEDDTLDKKNLVSLALQVVPAAAAVAVGSPGFSLVYAPLAVLGNNELLEAPPAATLIASTLLYACGATLTDQPTAPLLMTAAINLACAAALLTIGLEAAAESGSTPLSAEAMAQESWDQRLRAKSEQRRGRDPRMGISLPTDVVVRLAAFHELPRVAELQYETFAASPEPPVLLASLLPGPLQTIREATERFAREATLQRLLIALEKRVMLGSDVLVALGCEAERRAEEVHVGTIDASGLYREPGTPLLGTVDLSQQACSPQISPDLPRSPSFHDLR